MNKSKKDNTKKVLVRNTSRPLPPIRVIFEDATKPGQVKETTRPKSGDSGTFPKPRLNSAMRIGDEIAEIGKVGKPKSCRTAIDVAYNEKITRKINFPADQAIYKDLISLEPPAKCLPLVSSRPPLPQKDKEPSLASFVKPKPSIEFIYKPAVKPERRSIKSQMNSLRLYKILQANQ